MQSVSTSQVQGSTNRPHLPHWRTLLAFCAIICSFTNIDTDRKHNLINIYKYALDTTIDTVYLLLETLFRGMLHSVHLQSTVQNLNICLDWWRSVVSRKRPCYHHQGNVWNERNGLLQDWDHWCKGCKGCKGSINTKEIGCDLIVLY